MNTRPFLRKSFPVWIVFILLLNFNVALATPDDEYLKIFEVVSQADTLLDQGKTNSAYAKYVEAQRALVTLQRANPKWNVKMVTYRLNYLAEKISATAEKPVVVQEVKPTVTGSSSSAKSPEVKLVDAGAEPRSELRYHPIAGSKQSAKLGMKIGIHVTATGQEAQGMDTPVIEMGVDTEVKSITPDGNISYTMRIKDINVPEDASIAPDMMKELKSSFAGLTGMTATTTMTDHGISKSFSMKAPANAGADAKQMLDQIKETFSDMAFPLPNEPVGVGAAWELKRQVESEGLPINQIEKYELVSKEGDVVSIRATLVQSPGDKKGSNASLFGMGQVSGSGEANISQDLAKILPQSGRITQLTEISMEMDMGRGQQKQSMSMKMSAEMTFSAD